MSSAVAAAVSHTTVMRAGRQVGCVRPDGQLRYVTDRPNPTQPQTPRSLSMHARFTGALPLHDGTVLPLRDVIYSVVE